MHCRLTFPCWSKIITALPFSQPCFWFWVGSRGPQPLNICMYLCVCMYSLFIYKCIYIYLIHWKYLRTTLTALACFKALLTARTDNGRLTRSVWTEHESVKDERKRCFQCYQNIPEHSHICVCVCVCLHIKKLYMCVSVLVYFAGGPLTTCHEHAKTFALPWHPSVD